jgi:hypothetical protein
MRNSPTFAGKVCAAVTLITLFAASSFAQISLRKALDTDGDGKADYPIFRPSDQNWYILKSGGNGANIQQWGVPNTDFPTPGDYDGDGRADIAVWRDTTGVWYIINSADGTVNAVQWGVSGDEPVARDYDGDGKTDFAVARRTNGIMVWYVIKSGGGIDAQQWGVSTDFTAPGDYDGDGKFDFTVQRPGATPSAQATFYVHQSSGGVNVIDWGLGDDFAVPGDYDGDGKTDFAIVRQVPSQNNALVWYILQSQTFTARVVTWGVIDTDLICQADYDGDGQTDIAIWRNSTGQYFVIGSSSGLNLVQWGAPNDFPVASYDTH